MLADLDTKLQQESVRQGPPSGDSKGDAASAAGGGSSSFSNVLSVVDEIDFWDHQSARGNEGEAISIFREALQPIRQVSSAAGVRQYVQQADRGRWW